MDEIEYFRGNGTLVTSTRIEINGQTFAVRNVGSVKVTAPGEPLLAALILIGCFIAALFTGQWGYWVACVLAAGWIWETKRTRRLVLVAGGSEVMALSSRDAKGIESLRAAIAQAISTR